MIRSLNLHVRPPVAVRLAIDALSVNLALFFACVATLWWMLPASAEFASDFDAASMEHVLRAYAANAPLLTALSLAVFYRAGFYTHGLDYQGRHRFRTVVGAVLAAFIAYAALTFFAWDKLGIPALPLPALAMAGFVCVVLFLGTRVWPAVWDKVLRPERQSSLRSSFVPGCRVLVTGGAGYIGSALLPKLLDLGYRVRVLDRLVYGNSAIQKLLDHPHFELVEGDIRHVDDVVNAMQDVHAVVHLAAIVGDPACALDADLTIDVNLTATQRIAEVAKASGIQRFIFASTCSVYGAADGVLDETSAVRPVSLYGRTKLAAERGLRQMMDDTFKPTILRFSTIYGLSGRTRFDLVVNLLAAKAKIDGLITIQGGQQWRPFLHVDDAALAVASILTSDLRLISGETFNVGSEEQNYTITHIGQLVHKLVPEARIVVDDKITDTRNYRISFWKIRNRFGFAPKWSVEQGIRQVVDSVASGAVVDYHSAIYSNQKFLSETGAMEAIREQGDWSMYLVPAFDPPATTALIPPAAASPRGVFLAEPQAAS